MLTIAIITFVILCLAALTGWLAAMRYTRDYVQSQQHLAADAVDDLVHWKNVAESYYLDWIDATDALAKAHQEIEELHLVKRDGAVSDSAEHIIRFSDAPIRHMVPDLEGRDISGDYASTDPF
jgi:hypothetical protein